MAIVKRTQKRTERPVSPVETVREYSTALEAAMAVALAQPKKPAVHRLRVQTRRLEAQLTLLAQISPLPPESRELLRRLRKLRRAAGRVRDLDVQDEMLETQESLPREAAEELRGWLMHHRERKAAKLRKLLFRQLPKIAGMLEQVAHSLAASNGLVVPELRLVAMIEQWKDSQEVSSVEGAAGLDDEQLHDARKAAKAARYMAEGAAESAVAKKAAARYEAQQDAGGIWHDWVDLAAAAQEFFGRKHELTQMALTNRDTAKAEYLKLLATKAD